LWPSPPAHPIVSRRPQTTSFSRPYWSHISPTQPSSFSAQPTSFLPPARVSLSAYPILPPLPSPSAHLPPLAPPRSSPTPIAPTCQN
ncbi:unnamed protein product, partial [Closterium sp. Naga37s-1]